MSYNFLPSRCGQLTIDFQNNFKAEKQLHLTDEYLALLESARLNITDNDVCCFCGFPDGKFLELHHDDDDHTNNHPDNFSFICTLCHRLKHLGWVGAENLGKIFYVPKPTNLKENESAMWLEPINIIQRFYMMKDYLTLEQKERLLVMPLSENINGMLTAMKRQDVNDNYLEARAAKARRAEEIEELRNTSAEEKQKVAAAIDERRKKRVSNVQEESYFHDLHLLDLLQAIADSGDMIKQQFLKIQASGQQGRMTVWFNPSVFAPFEPNADYTLQDRLNHYHEMGMFTAEGLSRIMHNIRRETQFA